LWHLLILRNIQQMPQALHAEYPASATTGYFV
jgi:hypothetical protein